MSKKIYFIILLAIYFSTNQSFAQEKEIYPPYNIKTVTFVQNNQNTIPVFRMNDSFQFQFDDLYGDEANYFYTITHCDYDWKPSQLSKAEYIDGFDDQRIQNYTNSFNTLQLYSHYNLTFPNNFTRFKVSGNYVLKILNDSKEVVFTRKFILCEELVSVPMQVKRARNVNQINYKQNLEFSIKSQTIQFQSPLQNVKVLLMQNGQFHNSITNVKPMYTIGNDLIYKYDTETQFWGGNEFLFFDNKDIRNAVGSILRIAAKDIYETILYTNDARASKGYTYFPDKNGNFITRNINLSVTNQNLESDYTWVFFKLSAPEFYEKKDIYVGGMFNNYAKTDEYRLEYDEKTATYNKAIMIKQGFNNFMYITADKGGKVDGEHAVDGNYYQTEDDYNIFVYYRQNGERYDRVIGRGNANSQDIIN